MSAKKITTAGVMPLMSAIPLWGSSSRQAISLLSAQERRALGAIATVVRCRKGAVIFRQGAKANAVFSIVSGVAKTSRTASRDAEYVTAFYFPGDILGLAEEGKYVNTARAVRPLTLLRYPVGPLQALLKRDAQIEFHVITKMGHELRAAQRHVFLLGHRSATNKLALFLQMIEEYQLANHASVHRLYLPMTRAEIASYIGVTPETLSRSFATLADAGAIALPDKRHVTIINRSQFARALAQPGRNSGEAAGSERLGARFA